MTRKKITQLESTCRLPQAANENLEHLVDRQAADAIGQRLRHAFAPIVAAPIPDEILELVNLMTNPSTGEGSSRQ